MANTTGSGCGTVFPREGQTRVALPVPRYTAAELEHADLPEDYARQAFGRGLALIDDNHVIAGSSPATLTAWRLAPPTRLNLVKRSADIRNAVHGLAIGPFRGF